MSSWSATFSNRCNWSGGTSNADLHCGSQGTKSLETEHSELKKHLAAERQHVVCPPLKKDNLVREPSPDAICADTCTAPANTHMGQMMAATANESLKCLAAALMALPRTLQLAIGGLLVAACPFAFGQCLDAFWA